MKKLANMLPQVFESVRRAPPPWIREFDGWCSQFVGPKPVAITHRRASTDWELVVMGALLAWGYFAEVMDQAEAADAKAALAAADASAVEGANTPVAILPGEAVQSPASADLDTAGSRGAADSPPVDASREGDIAAALAVRPRYAVLGADGEPLIEGVRGLGE